MQTSNKHIFIVTYDYPPSNGGIARLCFELKKYLEKKGLNVTVICPQSTSTDAEEDNNVVRECCLYCQTEKPIYWHMEPNILPERVFSDAVFGLLIDVLY